jgi:hypothetical protein
MRLIQAATIRIRDDENTVRENLAKTPLLSMLDMEYMGSAEFEFGAIPKAILRFCKAQEPKVFGKLVLRAGKMLKPGPTVTFDVDKQTINCRDKQITIHYLVRKSKEQSLIMCLEQWAFGGHPLLMEPVYPGEPKTFHICIDEDSECFFGTDTQTFEVLIDGLPESYRRIRQNPSFRFDWDVTDPMNMTIEQIMAAPVLVPA